MTGWWVTNYLSAPGGAVLVISWAIWIIIAIVLHELAHGWAALWQGDQTPIETGHMTWNPIVHMGWWSLLAFALVGIAWGAMPINPNRFRSRYGEAWVALAGPAMNLLLALVCMVLGGMWLAWGAGAGPNLYANLQVFFLVGGMLNIVLAAFNLLPAPPLDGSRICAAFVPAYAQSIQNPNLAMGLMIGAIIGFNLVSDSVFGAGIDATRWGREAVAGLLGWKP